MVLRCRHGTPGLLTPFGSAGDIETLAWNFDEGLIRQFVIPGARVYARPSTVVMPWNSVSWPKRPLRGCNRHKTADLIRGAARWWCERRGRGGTTGSDKYSDDRQ